MYPLNAYNLFSLYCQMNESQILSSSLFGMVIKIPGKVYFRVKI